MNDALEALANNLEKQFSLEKIIRDELTQEVTIEVAQENLIDYCQKLHDNFSFHQLTDLCGLDYLHYGQPESQWQGKRFAVVYHLISTEKNLRLRVRCFVDEESMTIPSVIDIWSSANWYEREAFDLYGILFVGHPDLRRLLTDYGFIGHPFRKDFPISGHVEMRYDPEKRRVVYEPVSIQPRVNNPRVIRKDHRYVEQES